TGQLKMPVDTGKAQPDDDTTQPDRKTSTQSRPKIRRLSTSEQPRVDLNASQPAPERKKSRRRKSSTQRLEDPDNRAND
ncbi:MAG: hypothetical protein AAF787_05450, partial [Chloroflexota bacterium]